MITYLVFAFLISVILYSLWGIRPIRQWEHPDHYWFKPRKYLKAGAYSRNMPSRTSYVPVIALDQSVRSGDQQERSLSIVLGRESWYNRSISFEVSNGGNVHVQGRTEGTNPLLSNGSTDGDVIRNGLTFGTLIPYTKSAPTIVDLSIPSKMESVRNQRDRTVHLNDAFSSPARKNSEHEQMLEDLQKILRGPVARGKGKQGNW